jgi:hypothetical protein
VCVCARIACVFRACVWMWRDVGRWWCCCASPGLSHRTHTLALQPHAPTTTPQPTTTTTRLLLQPRHTRRPVVDRDGLVTTSRSERDRDRERDREGDPEEEFQDAQVGVRV